MPIADVVPSSPIAQPTRSGGLERSSLAAVPTIRFTEDSPILSFVGGPVIEQVAFSEEMCRSWMRYLSPLMANTTSIDGSFTLSIDAGEVELSQWPNDDVQGVLSIHSARVGPGPLTQQILGLVQQVRGVADRRSTNDVKETIGWLTIVDQQVPIVVHAGRVEHRNLRLSIGPVELESQGSVGLVDDSLDLSLVIRFPESWFANRPLLAGLRGDGLRIPIRGTLAQPQIEARPLRDLGVGIGVRAVDGLFQRLREQKQ